MTCNFRIEAIESLYLEIDRTSSFFPEEESFHFIDIIQIRMQKQNKFLKKYVREFYLIMNKFPTITISRSHVLFESTADWKLMKHPTLHQTTVP